MTNLPITLKVEKAFAGYIPAILTDGDLNFYEGHEAAEEKTFPMCVIYAQNSAPHPDMPRETGVRMVRMQIQFVVDSAVGDRVQLDAWKKQLEDAMMDVGSIQSSLNAPATGDDERAIKGIHFHDVMMADDPSDVVETDWREDMIYDVTAELLDELTP